MQHPIEPAVTDPEFWLREPERLLELDDAQVAYWRVGQGPDLVFVHGWPVSSSTWRGVVSALADRFTCHLFDLPGVGHSHWSGARASMLEVGASVLAAAFEAAQIPHAVVVSHDSGGGIARQLAAAHPGLVRGLVLGNTEIPGDRSVPLRRMFLLAKLPGMRVLLRTVMQVGWLRRSRTVGFGGCFADPAFVDGDFHRLCVEPLLADEERWRSAARMLKDFEWQWIDALEQVHANITCPTRFIWGARDPFFPVAKAREMLGQFSGPAELVEIPGGRLFVHEDFPEAFATHAAEFLQELGDGGHGSPRDELAPVELSGVSSRRLGE